MKVVICYYSYSSGRSHGLRAVSRSSDFPPELRDELFFRDYDDGFQHVGASLVSMGPMLTLFQVMISGPI